MRLDEQTRWWLRDHGLTWVPVTHGRPYADYTSWMRNELRSWLEEILLSPQALDRGVLQPSYVRNLVAEHMAGFDHTRKISMLLTLELWNRQFLD
jgi:asparagine synthase (glutamine-hydrolysing)